MAYTYILYSTSLDKYYVGATQTEVETRVDKHNEATYGSNHFTSRSNDWGFYLKIQCLDYAHAIRLERKIKSMKSSIYIQNLLKYPEMIAKIKLETKK